MLKALHEMVQQNADKEPYLISIGEKAEQIAQAFEERQKTTQESLQELERLVAELAEARQRRDETELSPEAFAVYWLLKRAGVEKAQQVAAESAIAFESHPYWRTSARHEQELRKSLYKALINADVDGVVDIAQDLMDMLKKASQ